MGWVGGAGREVGKSPQAECICPRFAEVPDFALSTLTRMVSKSCSLCTVHTVHHPVMNTCLASLHLPASDFHQKTKEPTIGEDSSINWELGTKK